MRISSVGAALSVIFVALGAAACGSNGSSAPAKVTPTSAKTTASAEVDSLDASRSVQITFALKSGAIPVARSGAVNNPRQLVEGLRLTVDLSANQATTIANAGSAVGTEVNVTYGTSSLAKFIVDGPHVYFYVSTTAASSLPLSLSASDEQTVSEAMAFIGGKWFELPDSLFKSAVARARALAPGSASATGASGATGPSTPQVLAYVRSLERDVLQASTIHSSTTANGTKKLTITGTFAKLESALLPTISKIESSIGKTAPSSLPTKDTKGSYLATLLSQGSSLTGLTLSVATPTGSGSLSLAIAHANVVVVAPVGATPLPQSVIQEFASGV
jgi:hypothetical protein